MVTLDDATLGIHSKLKKSLADGKDQLAKVEELLTDPKNKSFCHPELQRDLCNEIKGALAEESPNVIIGCLGGTGVGKSWD